MKKNLVVTVSGGRSSAMMAYHIHTSAKYKDYEKLYVFCNTGMERPETIDFLKDIVKYWEIPLNIIEGVYSIVPGVGVKSKLVDFDTMDMEGKVFKNMIEHFNKLKWGGLPNPATPYCSNYLKNRPTNHFAKSIYSSTKFITAIGYRSEDMPKRITIKELIEDKKRIAPLLTDFDFPISQKDLNIFFASQPFKLNLESNLGNCELCWKKSDKNLIKAIQKGTRFIDWHNELEKNYNDCFFRNNRSINDLVNLANSGTQLSLLDDIGDKCVCNF